MLLSNYFTIYFSCSYERLTFYIPLFNINFWSCNCLLFSITKHHYLYELYPRTSFLNLQFTYYSYWVWCVWFTKHFLNVSIFYHWKDFTYNGNRRITGWFVFFNYNLTKVPNIQIPWKIENNKLKLFSRIQLKNALLNSILL